MAWIISYPCWGKTYRQRANEGPLFSVLMSIRRAGLKNVTVLVNTDDAQSFTKIFAYFSEIKVKFYPLDLPLLSRRESDYRLFAICHQHALDVAEEGDRVVLLCSDMTVSLECFEAVDRILSGEKQLVLCAAPGTVGVAPLLPARDLLEWAFRHLSSLFKDLFWNEGRSLDPWGAFFRSDVGVDFRGFHLHALACIKRKNLFIGNSTSDVGLSSKFSTEEIHVVQSPDELAVVARVFEPTIRSGRWRIFEWLYPKLGEKQLLDWFRRTDAMATRRHSWQFAQRITLLGEPSNFSDPIAKRISEASAELAKDRGLPV